MYLDSTMIQVWAESHSEWGDTSLLSCSVAMFHTHTANVRKFGESSPFSATNDLGLFLAVLEDQ